MTIYDQFNALETPELSPSATTKHQSYFCKVSRYEDSDTSSVSSLEEVTDEAHRPIWWNILDADSAAATEAGLHNYKDFLRDQSHKDHTFKQQPKARASLTMAKIEAEIKPVHANKTVSLPSRQKGQKQDHTHIVEEMQDSHDLAGPVEFCFWSMNGQPCQCGRC